MRNILDINEFLGAFQDKYENIFPIIRLVIYRMDVGGIKGLFGYEGETSKLSCKRGTRLLHKIARYVLMCFPIDLKYKGNNRILVSDTVLKLDRYNDMICSLQQEYDLFSIVAQDSFNRCDKKWEVHPMIFNDSFSGRKLKESLIRTYEMFCNLIENEKNCEDEYQNVDIALGKLERTVNKRLLAITRKFKKKRINCFITINQFNLKDVLCVLACRKLNITSKELCHYSHCVAALGDNKPSYLNEKNPYHFRGNKKSFMLASEYCLWSIHDIKFYNKYKKQRNIFGEPIIIKNCGCLEVVEFRYNELKVENEKNDIICLFVPEYGIYFGGNYSNNNITQSDIHEIAKKRNHIYQKMRKIKEETGYSIKVRFHPFEPIEFVQNEAEDIRKLGLELLSPSRDDLYKVLIRSKVIIASGSSTLILGYIFGCKCYCINVCGEKYDFCGMDIHEVMVDDLDNISVEIDEDTKVHPEMFFQPEILKD